MRKLSRLTIEMVLQTVSDGSGAPFVHFTEAPVFFFFCIRFLLSGLSGKSLIFAVCIIINLSPSPLSGMSQMSLVFP